MARLLTQNNFQVDMFIRWNASIKKTKFLPVKKIRKDFLYYSVIVQYLFLALSFQSHKPLLTIRSDKVQIQIYHSICLCELCFSAYPCNALALIYLYPGFLPTVGT